jgi:hypothetical protein
MPGFYVTSPSKERILNLSSRSKSRLGYSGDYGDECSKTRDAVRYCTSL